MSKIIVPRTIHVFVSLVLCTVSIVSLANTDSTIAMLEALESEWNQASVSESGLSEGLFEIKSFTIIVAKNRTGSRRLRAD